MLWVVVTFWVAFAHVRPDSWVVALALSANGFAAIAAICAFARSRE